MPIAADYPFLEVVWTMVVFFGWLIWLWILVKVLGDILRRHEISGWKKAAWTLFVVILPFIGVLIYLVAQGEEMGHRDVEQARAARTQLDDYVRSVGAQEDPVAQIERAKRLLDSGAIDQAEFDALKAKATG